MGFLHNLGENFHGFVKNSVTKFKKEFPLCFPLSCKGKGEMLKEVISGYKTTQSRSNGISQILVSWKTKMIKTNRQ